MLSEREIGIWWVQIPSTPPLRWLGNCFGVVCKNVTGRFPGAPDDTPARCAIGRGHCPPVYRLMVEISGMTSSNASSRMRAVSREVNMFTPFCTAQRRISTPSS